MLFREGSGRGFLGRRRRDLALLKETLTTIDGSSLGWLKRDRCNLPALRTGSLRLDSRSRSVKSLIPFGLALFAPFGLVAEILGCKEKLFSCRKNELSPAVHANKGSVLVFHGVLPRRNT
jgi:hypothetical protein